MIAGADSRRGHEAFGAIPELLRQRRIDVLDIGLEESRQELVKAVRRAISHKAELIVVCGGDGTLTSVVGLFAKRKSVLGVVPAGTGNSFALGLGIPDSFEAAADVIAYGCERRVDLGVVNGNYFANFITIGLAAQVAEETPRLLKRVIGPIAYGATAIGPLLSHKPFRADIRWEGHRVHVQTHQIIVANGRFYGHQPLAPDATLNDGRLTVFVRDASGRANALETYLALLRGKAQNLSGVHIFSTDRVLKIQTKPKSPVAADGDKWGKTPIRVRVEPEALRVMAPTDEQVLT